MKIARFFKVLLGHETHKAAPEFSPSQETARKAWRDAVHGSNNMLTKNLFRSRVDSRISLQLQERIVKTVKRQEEENSTRLREIEQKFVERLRGTQEC